MANVPMNDGVGSSIPFKTSIFTVNWEVDVTYRARLAQTVGRAMMSFAANLSGTSSKI